MGAVNETSAPRKNKPRPVSSWREKRLKGVTWPEYVAEYRRSAPLPRSRRDALAPLEVWLAERQIGWSRPACEALRRLAIERQALKSYAFKIRSGMTPTPEGFLAAICSVLHVPPEERAALIGADAVSTLTPTDSDAAIGGNARQWSTRDHVRLQSGRQVVVPALPVPMKNWTVA